MFEAFLTSVDNWKKTKNERQKLQHAYVVLVVAITLSAGVISLFNGALGHTIVKLALICGGAFLVNAIAWNLLQASVLDKLPTKTKSRQR